MVSNSREPLLYLCHGENGSNRAQANAKLQTEPLNRYHHLLENPWLSSNDENMEKVITKLLN